MGAGLGVDAATWARASPLLDELLDLPAAERKARLDALSAADRELRPLLERLLAESEAALPRLPLAGPSAGDFVGPYRLLAPLGHGGMGEVWRAVRADGLLQREVALKLPQAEGPAGRLAQRMARERDILAALVHPHIARLYDAGLDHQGRPFLALELVEGERIDLWAERRRADLRQRVRLVLQAARAVAHAHAQLVVHRDIKPSNLLVDAAGQVKLLDFGIAKLLDDELAPGLTEVGAARPMTPAYASPEQLAGAPVGTRSDLYSLAVVMFELLTGSSPYRPADDSRRALEDAVLHAGARRASEAVADRRLARPLRGDLDLLLSCALARAPEERYPSADAFAADLERWLEGRPLLVRPQPRRVQLARFVRRNRLAVATGTLTLAAVVGAAAVALWQARLAQHERLRAEQVKTFVAGILRDASPYNGRDVAHLSAADLVRQADERLRAAQIASPEVRVELGTLLGESLLTLGDVDAAEPVLKRVAEEARRELGDADFLTLRARLVAAQLQRFRGQVEEQHQVLQQILPVLRERAPRDPASMVEALAHASLNAVDRGAYDEAERLAQEGRQIAIERLGAGSPDAASIAIVLATAQRYARHFEQARQVAEQALALVRAAYPGPVPHPRLMEAQAIYGRALADVGELAAGIAQIEAAGRVARQLFGPDSVPAGTLRQNLVAYQIDWGETAKAVENGREALRVVDLQATPESFTHAATTAAYGQALLADGRVEEAAAPLLSAAERLQRVLGPAHDAAVFAAANAALVQALGGQPAAAQARLDAIAETLRGQAISAATRARATLARAVALRTAGDAAAALAQLGPLLADTDSAPRLQRERLRARLESGQALLALSRRAEAAAQFEAAQAEAARLQSPAGPLAAAAARGLALARGS